MTAYEVAQIFAAYPAHLGDFMRRVNAPGPDDYWPWQGCIDAQGYGVYSCERKNNRAHRVVYELFVGPIPTGLVIDHLCRVRSCVNPSHLEAVTRGENVLRGESSAAQRARATHCIYGHPWTPDNTSINPRGHRRCRECNRRKMRERSVRGAA